MSDETLLSAARRVVRFFNIDMNKGGLMTVETQSAIEQLDAQVRLEEFRQKQQEQSGDRDRRQQ